MFTHTYPGLTNPAPPTPHTHTNTHTPLQPPQFVAKDLESVSGKYDVVTCLDVMIHYPQDKADAMITHLASLTSGKLLISFAPLVRIRST